MHPVRFLVTTVTVGLVSSLWSGCGETAPAPVAAGQPRPAEGQDETAESSRGLVSLWTRKRGSDWTAFLGPTGDSKSSETGIIAPWPESGPRIVWQREIGSGYGIGSISAGRYFHFDRHQERGSRGQARLTCMNAETGEDIWTFEYASEYEDMLGYNNGPRASPVIDGDRVYIFGVEGMIHCLSASDGKLVWKVDTAQQFGVVQNFFGAGSTPVVYGELLICIVGGSPPGSPGLYVSNGQVDGNGSGIVAFNKRTGAVEYSISDELASYASPRLATIDGRPWCFAFCRGGLVGFEPKSGKVDFHFPWRATLLESVNASTPVVVGNEVFISEAYQIGSSMLAVRPGSADVVWQDERRVRDKSMRAHWNTPVYVDGYLYGCSGRNPPDSDLRCIDWKTGQAKWVEKTRVRSSLLFVDGHFVCLGEYGTLQLIKANPDRCEIVSEVTLRRDEAGADPIDGGKPRLLRYPCWAAPILSHGLLYVRGDDRLVCMELISDKD